MALYHVVLTTPETSQEKLKFTGIEMQQLPDFQKTDSKEEVSCLKWTFFIGRRKVRVKFQTDTDKLNIVMYRYRNSFYFKDNEVFLKMTEYQSLLAKRAYLMSYIDIFYKRCIVLGEKIVHDLRKHCKVWMFFSSWSFFDWTRVGKKSFEHNGVRKNFFLSSCFCWVSRLSLREMDQNCFFFGGIIGCGDSYLEFQIRHFKVFRLHAKLHDAAGAVRAHSGKGSGYCYMIGRGPISSFLGNVTGLFFCLYVKLFLPSIFNSVDFWCSSSCFVLDIELTEKKTKFRNVGFFWRFCTRIFILSTRIS